MLPHFAADLVLTQAESLGGVADGEILDCMDDPEVSLILGGHAGGLFEGATGTLGEVHSDDYGL